MAQLEPFEKIISNSKGDLARVKEGAYVTG